MADKADDKVPVRVEQPEEERTWRDVASQWKQVGKEVKDLGDRLATAFREGWDVEDATDTEARKLADRLKELGERLDTAVDSVREEVKDPETRTQAKKTVKATREASTELLSELQETLSEGLQDVNRRVDDLIKKRRGKKAN